MLLMMPVITRKYTFDNADIKPITVKITFILMNRHSYSLFANSLSILHENKNSVTCKVYHLHKGTFHSPCFVKTR